MATLDYITKEIPADYLTQGLNTQARLGWELVTLVLSQWSSVASSTQQAAISYRAIFKRVAP